MAHKSFNKTVQRDHKIGVFDIETHKWIHPYAVGFFDGENYSEFLGGNCIKDFINEVVRKKYRGYRIYAHNGGKFDFNFLMEVLKSKNFNVNMIFQGSRCLLLKLYTQVYRNDDGAITHSNVIQFVDSISLLKFGLDALTKDFDVEHKKLNFMDKKGDERDYEYLYRLYLEKDKRFYDYLKNDVYGLYEVLMKFKKLIMENNGQMGMTIASTSLKTFQTGYLQKKICMTNRESNDEMKKGYYGGRTEIFRLFLPEDKYRCYDVNSLYPYVMFNNDFPISKPKTIHNPTKTMIKELCGITECAIVTPKKMYLPVLPYKLNIGGHNKLVFPLGKFNGHWDNLQLKKAMEIGYRVFPKKMMVFETDYIFKDYVKTFYKLKQNSKVNTPNYVLAKLMLNSLYGKFAQSQDSEMVVKINNPKDLLNLEIVDVVDLDHNLFKVKTESKGNFFIPQISIHVTALAQLRLYKFMEMLLDKGKIVSYCDTDSLFTDGFLPTSNKLGDMKNEYEFISGYFMLPKTYCIVKKDGTVKVKAKGFMRDFQKQLNEKSFKKALFKKDYSDFKITSDIETFNTMKTSFVRHKNFVSTDVRKKSIHAVYDKRKILKDFNTDPLII